MYVTSCCRKSQTRRKYNGLLTFSNLESLFQGFFFKDFAAFDGISKRKRKKKKTGKEDQTLFKNCSGMVLFHQKLDASYSCGAGKRIIKTKLQDWSQRSLLQCGSCRDCILSFLLYTFIAASCSRNLLFLKTWKSGSPCCFLFFQILRNWEGKRRGTDERDTCISDG